MTKEEAEKFFDEHIGPELRRLGELCADNKMNMLCLVEYHPLEMSTTFVKGAEKINIDPITVHIAMKKGNEAYNEDPEGCWPLKEKL